MTNPCIRGRRVTHDGWTKLIVADVTLPDGAQVSREIEDHGRAVAVLPYDPARRLAVLVRQFRTPPFHLDGTLDILEVPAGLLDEADAEAGARREVLEEVGLRLGEIEHVMSSWTMPGVSTERMELFLASFREADRVAEGGGLAEENEAITVVEMPLADLAALADGGELTDLKTLALVQTLRLRRPALFDADA